MASDQGDREAAKAKTDRTAEELGRKAARLFRRGKPRLEQAMNDARPRVEEAVNKARPQVEKSAKDAWQYAQDHEDEIRNAAIKGARTRIRGPFGFLIDALQGNQQPAQPTTPACPSCAAPIQPNARFCTECGSALTSDKS
jgi:hypothetical protein